MHTPSSSHYMETFDSLLTLPLFVAQHHTAQKRCTITYYKNRNEGKEKKKRPENGRLARAKGRTWSHSSRRSRRPAAAAQFDSVAIKQPTWIHKADGLESLFTWLSTYLFTKFNSKFCCLSRIGFQYPSQSILLVKLYISCILVKSHSKVQTFRVTFVRENKFSSWSKLAPCVKLITTRK